LLQVLASPALSSPLSPLNYLFLNSQRLPSWSPQLSPLHSPLALHSLLLPQLKMMKLALPQLSEN
jgi:hypothetical protein